jgi:transposase-like protein
MSKQRRQFTPEFKVEVVLEGLRGEKSVAQLCREHDITDSLYYSWREQFLARAPTIFAEPAQQAQAEAAQEAHMADLERMVGKLALENEVLKKAQHLLGAPRRKNGR